MFRLVIIAVVLMVAASACGVSDGASDSGLSSGDASDPADSVPPDDGERLGRSPEPAPEVRVESTNIDSTAADSPAEDRTPPRVSPESAPQAVRSDPLSAEVIAIASASAGHVGIAVIDLETSAVYTYEGDRRVPLASVAKVPLMLATLSEAPSMVELDLVFHMITRSDNIAADALWFTRGRQDRVRELWQQIGLWPDEVAIGDRWGATEAGARSVALLFASAAAGDLYSTEVWSGAQAALEHVIAEQAWGMTAGVSESLVVGLKNGWLEHGDGWLIHSAGYVRDPDGDPRYVIAILTSDHEVFADAVATIEAISALVHAAFERPVVPSPSRSRVTP
jgi:beta-lactamase class A